ncbi:uncharacterized protein [Aegilops tauschii subsp. strangulata]|uniref:uncharacterized protein n=1 Tax=Aegilops tauschii subsp. strangulata TaxID=200361 RepID=UPI003CC8D98E
MASEKATASSSAAGTTWYELGLMAPCVIGEKLQTTLLLTVSDDNEWRETTLRVATAVPEPAGSNFFPFFMDSVYSGLVPPFSPFFFAILHHYGLHALHIHANSILLLPLFAFYCEAFMGVLPSVALFRHFFYLRKTGDNPVECIGFVAGRGRNAISRAGKKVEDAVKRWVLMDAKSSQSSLKLSTAFPISDKCWKSEKITDPALTPFVRTMDKELKDTKLTGAMLIREFLKQRIALLQDRPRPLWKLGGDDDKIRLRRDPLPEVELNKVLSYLTGKDPSDPPEGWLPLYDRDDTEEVVAAMPIFDDLGFVRLGSSLPPTTLVLLSSGGQSSEATEDDVVDESSAPEQRELLHDLPANDDDGEPSVVEVPRPPGVTTRSAVASLKQHKRAVLKKSRTAVISPGSSPPSLTPSRAAPTASSPAPKSPAPAAPPQVPLLSMKRQYAFVDQQQPAKKQKEGAEIATATSDGAASAALVKKSAAACATPEVTPSPEDLDVHPQEAPVSSAGLTPPAPSLIAAAGGNQSSEPPVLHEAGASSVLVLRASPPLPSAWSSHGVPAPSGTLEEARATLDLLQGELQGPDCCSARGRLGLISGWLRADVFVRVAWGSTKEAQKALGVAATARDLARKEATEAENLCRAAKAELKALQDQQATWASQLQEREEKLKAQEAAIAVGTPS